MEITIEKAIELAVEAHKAGNLPDAERLYLAILQIQPKHADANHNLGILTASVNKPELARHLFKTALEANPNQGQYWISYVDTILKLNQLEEASSVLEQGRRLGLVGPKVEALEAHLAQLKVDLESKKLEANELHLAITLREKGRYKDAQKWLTNFLRTDPNNAEAWSLLSQVYLLDENFEQAEKALAHAIYINSELPSIYRNQARLLLKKAKPEEALLKARSGYELSKSDIESWLVLAACLGSNQKESEALSLIERALQTKPNYAEAFATRAIIRLRAKELTGAIEDLDKAVSFKPYLTQHWGLLGSLRYQINNLSGAIEALRMAHKLEPENANFMINLGEFLRQDKNIEEAIVVLEAATKLAPENVNAWINLGTALQQDHKIDSAKLAYEKAISINPNLAEISNNLGAIAKNNKDLAAAQRYYQKALEIKPNLTEAHLNLGVIFQELGRLNEAEISYKKAIDNHPDYAEAYCNLGNTLKELGRLEEAEVSYRKAIASKPNYTEVYNNLGTILHELGKLEETEKSYRKAISLKPDYESAQYNLGIWYCEQGKYKQAAELLLKSKNFKNSQSYLLKCWYFQNEQSLFYEQLESLTSQGITDAIIGSFGCRAGSKFGIEKANLFCSSPLNYVFKTDLSKKYDFQEKFVKPTLSILDDTNTQNRSQNLLTNGLQTSGNLFAQENILIDEIKKIIELEIENYRLYFKDSKEGLIKNWPEAYSLHGWIIRMKNGGALRPHMHEKGWVSGSIYINVPPKLNTNDGNLVVCIEDDALLSELQDNKKNIIDVTTGSLCLFPASLLHYTIPFESDEERIVFAFDVIPKNKEFF